MKIYGLRMWDLNRLDGDVCGEMLVIGTPCHICGNTHTTVAYLIVWKCHIWDTHMLSKYLGISVAGI